MRRFLSDRQGFTLTESAIVLGVIGVVLAGVWTIAGAVTEKANVSNAVNQFNTVLQNMTAFGASGYTANAQTDITVAMINNQVIPSWAASGTNGTNPWSANGFKIWWVQNAPRMFRLSFYNIKTQSACISMLLQSVACTNTQSGCVANFYTGGASGSYTTNNGQLATSLSVAQATASCAINTYPSGNNSLEFDIYM